MRKARTAGLFPKIWPTRRRLRAGYPRAQAFLLLAATACLILPATAPAEAPEARLPADAEELRLSFSPVVRSAAPAVVNIAATREQRGRDVTSPLLADPFFRRFFDRGRDTGDPASMSLGSGVIVGGGELVVTNNHVIEGADEVTVILADRREFPAERLRVDQAADLALLRIDSDGAVLPALAFADSDALAVGDLVLAIGNPFGIGQSVSSGIISATMRSTPGLDLDIPVIQTDAAINPGNSGGALVDLRGDLVGVNTAILTRGGGSLGVGFAIPANYVRAFVGNDGGEAAGPRPWLGVRVQPVDADLADTVGLGRPRGVLVADVFIGAAADRAGIVVGDVILAVDGVAVDAAGMLNLRLALASPGASVAFELWRDGAVLRLELRPDAPPGEPLAAERSYPTGHPFAGLTVANLSPAYALEQGFDPFQQGVAVLGVEPRSPARRLRLRPGDVIVDANGRAVRTQADLEEVLAARPLPLRLLIERGGRRIRLVLS
ncbi:MAG: trypsin-like peptidase domain-containing protein [Pseudomonadota bacterium]